MWEFPNGRVNDSPAKGLPKVLKKGYNLLLRIQSRVLQKQASVRNVRVSDGDAIGIVRHGYSHFSVEVHVFRCELLSAPQGTNLRWVPLKKLDKYPMGKIDRQIANLIAK